MRIKVFRKCMTRSDTKRNSINYHSRPLLYLQDQVLSRKRQTEHRPSPQVPEEGAGPRGQHTAQHKRSHYWSRVEGQLSWPGRTGPVSEAAFCSQASPASLNSLHARRACCTHTWKRCPEPCSILLPSYIPGKTHLHNHRPDLPLYISPVSKS